MYLYTYTDRHINYAPNISIYLSINLSISIYKYIHTHSHERTLTYLHTHAHAHAHRKASVMAKNYVRFGSIDVTQHSAVASQFKVNGYPTIITFPAGKKTPGDMKKYTGPRQAKVRR